MKEKLYNISLIIGWILVVANAILSVVYCAQKFYDHATYHLVLFFGLTLSLLIVMFVHSVEVKVSCEKMNKDETEDNHSD
jgi:uncharacterized membrane protein